MVGTLFASHPHHHALLLFPLLSSTMISGSVRTVFPPLRHCLSTPFRYASPSRPRFPSPLRIRSLSTASTPLSHLNSPTSLFSRPPSSTPTPNASPSDTFVPLHLPHRPVVAPETDKSEDQFDIVKYMHEKLAIVTPPLGVELPPVGMGDIVEIIKNGKTRIGTVVGYEGTKGVKIQFYRSDGSPFPTPSKCPLKFITFRFPFSGIQAQNEAAPSSDAPRIFEETLEAKPAAIQVLTRRLVDELDSLAAHRMWEAFAPAREEITAKDAKDFLFGKDELTGNARLGAMLGNLPIAHLYAAHTVLTENPLYFEQRAAGSFVCRTAKQVAWGMEEKKALQNVPQVRQFLRAAQRILWGDTKYTSSNAPIEHRIARNSPAPHPSTPSDSSETTPAKNSNSQQDEWDLGRYPHYVALLKRYALAHNRLELLDQEVADKLLLPLGAETESHDVVVILEKLRVFPERANVHVMRRQLVESDVMEAFPANVRETFDANRLQQVEDPDLHRRRDLRSLQVYTIDSPTTVEIDDGLSIEFRGPDQKEWALIHIADPTRWMVPNNDLDLCARKRASTLYLPELVQSMLPLEIARDVMSLLPSHPSHALTFAVRLGEDGGVEEYEIFPSLLQNIKRTNYYEVDATLDSNGLSDPALHRLYEFALKRRAWRRRAGAYLTNFPKAEAKVHDGGSHVDVMFECQSDSKAQILVSEMMILTGQITALYAQAHKIPVAYRTQPPPQVESEEYDAFLRTLPPIVREFEYISVMNRATGSAEPARHFGVGFDGYARASSPIRRYSDILVHYQLKAHLRGDPLPFSLDEMKKVIGGMEEREKEIFMLQRDSSRFWILQYLAQEGERIYTGLALTVNDDNAVFMVMEVGTTAKVQLQEGTGMEVKRGEIHPILMVNANHFSAKFELLKADDPRLLRYFGEQPPAHDTIL